MQLIQTHIIKCATSDSLARHINKFMENNRITPNKLVDIKYNHVVAYNTTNEYIQYSAMIVYIKGD